MQFEQINNSMAQIQLLIRINIKMPFVSMHTQRMFIVNQRTFVLLLQNVNTAVGKNVKSVDGLHSCEPVSGSG
jgi:hypothetical protein